MARGCEHAVEHLYEFIDREAGWYHKVRIRWHLRRCGHCVHAFNFEAHFKEVVRRRGFEDPPPELINRLHALLEEHRADPPQA
jgi:anti-sigma factor (TIGR02949 family)